MRLKVITGRMKEATLLTITPFQNAYEATQYLKTITNKKELFTSLGTVKYEIYTTSDENLKKLIETENMVEWGKFYQTYFVRRTPPAPVKPEDKPEVKNNENQKEQAPVLPKDNVETPKAEENKTLVADSVNVAKKVSSEKVEPIVTTADSTKLIKDSIPVIKTQEVKELYSFTPGAAHNLIYMLPAKSSNQNLLITYLNRLNAMKYRNTKITVTTEAFDNFRVMVIIKGFESKEKAAAYFEDAKADPRISMSLKNINYKSYLISNENLQTLKTTKDIVEYQKFHDKNY